MATDFERRCREIAEGFLQTVVVVDDGAYIEYGEPNVGRLRPPGRRVAGREAEEATGLDRGTDRNLDAKAIVDAFSRRGVVCSVVVPTPRERLEEAVIPVVRRADMAVLDWKLGDDDGTRTLDLVSAILREDKGERLRLIVVYTDSPDLSEIGRRIAGRCGAEGIECGRANEATELDCSHTRISVYAKAGVAVAAPLEDRSVSESSVAERWINDFATMTRGLLPGLALASLAAAREGTHRILRKFSPELDAAFLTHRACLPFPDDAQQHLVELLGDEVRAIMSDAVVTGEVARAEAVTEWLDERFGAGTGIRFGEIEVPRDQVDGLLGEGWEHGRPEELSRTRGFRHLTTGFAGSGDGGDLDGRLAWMFNFRTVISATQPMLGLGTVLCEDEGRFLCMRPRCDSVRLSGTTTFLLLPLIDPAKKLIQFVVRTGTDVYQRLGVCMDAERWVLRQFVPSGNAEGVRAEPDGERFFFTDVEGARFEFLGELRLEFAQRVAQHFSEKLARIPVNNSEWLRREERIG